LSVNPLGSTIGEELGTSTLAPVLEVVSWLASTSDAVKLENVTATLPDALGETRNVQFTNTPSGITRVSNPPTMTVFPKKLSDFPAPAAPNPTDCSVRSEETKVHSTVVQASPPVDAMESGSVTVPPGIPAPDARESAIRG